MPFRSVYVSSLRSPSPPAWAQTPVRVLCQCSPPTDDSGICPVLDRQGEVSLHVCAPQTRERGDVVTHAVDVIGSQNFQQVLRAAGALSRKTVQDHHSRNRVAPSRKQSPRRDSNPHSPPVTAYPVRGRGRVRGHGRRGGNRTRVKGLGGQGPSTRPPAHAHGPAGPRHHRSGTTLLPHVRADHSRTSTLDTTGDQAHRQRTGPPTLSGSAPLAARGNRELPGARIGSTH